MKILGFQTGHDVAYSILENGIPLIHEELERFTRQKEPLGDGLKMAFKYSNYDLSEINYFTLGNYGMYKEKGIKKWKSKGCYYPRYVRKMNRILRKNNGQFYEFGHHKSHAANAFFSSNFDEALILTIDGGGQEEDGSVSAFTVWRGVGNKIQSLDVLPITDFNLGHMWNHYTVTVFGLSGTAGPKGSQAGTIMGMSALGNYKKYISRIDDINFLISEAKKSEQNQFDISAAMQYRTETLFKEKLNFFLKKYPSKHLCLSGGVALNCVMVGKIRTWFPQVENIFVDPIPYDGGLSLGSSRYLWHHLLDNPRIKWEDSSSPYLGRKYSLKHVEKAIKKVKSLKSKKTDLDDIVSLLANQNIISVFNEGSESGRRALGNRSIIADPRSDKMKDLINEKVKHRQWFRPFAPSILKSEVSNWFETEASSPYMSFASKFKPNKKDKVPAVVHFDGTARLQTVSEKDNKWYFNLLSKWNKATRVPILLNTSFNDREPIVETPENAIDCFLRTNIDYLYFAEFKLLVHKK